jgi:hypothetical protein
MTEGGVMNAKQNVTTGWRPWKSFLVTTLVSSLVAVGLGSARVTRPAGEPIRLMPIAGTPPYRAFSDSSEWNKRLPAKTPRSKKSDQIIAELKSFDPSVQYPKFAIGTWALPVYFARKTDPVYTIRPRDYGPTLYRIHIPLGAKPGQNADAPMVVFDRTRSVVFELIHGVYDAQRRTWSAVGTSLYGLASNGLSCALPESNRTCPMNSGHRGIPPAIHAVRYGEVKAGAVRHVIKVALDRTGECHVYPASGHEDGQGGKICEGTILRIKEGVDLSRRRLSYGCLVIAKAIKRYGVVVGDTGGTPMQMKLENLELEGRPQRWSSLGVTENCFKGKISFNDFVAVRLGYHRP